jgi:predicted  nucleic acid-binding Zn-ribbon protein
MGGAQDALDKTTKLDEKDAFSQRIEELKSNADLLKTDERDSNMNLQDMQQRLQDAQDKLASIDAELSTAISRLAPMSK